MVTMFNYATYAVGYWVSLGGAQVTDTVLMCLQVNLCQVNIPAPASWLTAVENRGCGVIKERKVVDIEVHPSWY